MLRIKELNRVESSRSKGRIGENALGDTRVFCVQSAEVVEGKGDEVRFCTQTVCTESVRARGQGLSAEGLEVQPGGGA